MTVIAHHIILCTYGFWLPNDPRGSHSKFVWSPEIATFGEATTVNDGRSRATDSHDQSRRFAAKEALKFPEVILSGQQALILSQGIAEAVEKNEFRFLAYAIMEQHLHCVAISETMKPKEIVMQMKRYGSNRLTREKQNPLYSHRNRNGGRIPSIWAQGYWCIHIKDTDQLRTTIKYVEENPVKDGKRRQRWSFVDKHID